jgi:hypothetical protein
MDWVQTLSIMATVIGCAYYIHRDIMTDMKAQTARTDRLYEMFCELRKEMYENTQKQDQKFYDILKEQRK